VGSYLWIDWQKVDWSQLYSPSTFKWQYGVTPFSHSQILLSTSVFYLVSIFSLQSYMKDKKALSLKKFSFYHNIFLTVLSFFMFAGACLGALGNVWEKGFFHGYLCEQDRDPMHGSTWFWAYIFYLSKYYELVDSYLLVFKKKDLIFLHVWHHVVMPYVCWAGLEGKWCMALLTSTIFNAFVHVVMYAYYTLVDLGISVWWKKYLTQLQISQFLTGVGVTTLFMFFYFEEISIKQEGWNFRFHLRQGCSGDLWAVFGMYFVNNSFLVLFIKWYIDNYKKIPKKPPSELKPAGSLEKKEN
jgi:fatty acid elongase 3